MRLAGGTSLPTVTAAPSVRVAATKSATEPPRSNPTTPMRSALTSRSASQPNAVSVSATTWSRSSRPPCSWACSSSTSSAPSRW